MKIRSTMFAVVLLLLLAPSLLQAAPHPPCSCELCLADPGAKCTPPEGGVASCRTLIRSGACLGLAAITESASQISLCSLDTDAIEPAPLLLAPQPMPALPTAAATALPVPSPQASGCVDGQGCGSSAQCDGGQCFRHKCLC